MMEKTPRVVYLEDLEKPVAAIKENLAVTVTETDTGTSTTAHVEANVISTTTNKTTKVVTKKTETKSGTKRQRSLMDMLSPSSSSASSKVAKTDSPTLNSIPFSLSEFQRTFSEEEKKLLALECETMGKSWLKVLKDEIRKPYFLELKQFLDDKGVKGPSDSAPNLSVYPQPKNIYTWSNLTPLGRVKVVIIGQDPYHGPGQAHGLCFSVPPGVPVPPSLRNIYTEIKSEYPSFEPPKHGNLTAWAENGVLLLNSVLTVDKNKAGSHQKRGWEKFTSAVIDIVDRYGGANLGERGGFGAGRSRGIVFLAWGAWAIQCVAKLDKKKHLILTSPHPSPFSAHKGFLGNGHFKKANDWLEEKYGPDGCVDWTKL